jgi:hypothetical protein
MALCMLLFIQFNKIVSIINDGQLNHSIDQIIHKKSVDLILENSLPSISAIEILNKMT